jgi:hypothetical protein
VPFVSDTVVLCIAQASTGDSTQDLLPRSSGGTDWRAAWSTRSRAFSVPRLIPGTGVGTLWGLSPRPSGCGITASCALGSAGGAPEAPT